jgi:O-antigen/teichoic acid export membrane protein
MPTHAPGHTHLLGRLVRGTGVSLAGMAVGSVLGLGFIAFIARFLSDAELGQYFLGLTIVRLLSVGSLMGLEQGLRRYVARFHAQRDDRRLRGTIRTALVIALPLSLIFAAGLYLGAEVVAHRLLHKPGMAAPLRWYAFALPPLAISSLFVAAAQGLQVMRLKVYVRDLMEPVVRIIVAGFLFFLGLPLFGAITSQAVALVLATVVGYWLLGQIFPRPIFGEGASPGAELFWFSLPLSLSAFLGQLLGWMSSLMLGALAPIETVGSYNLAHRVVLIGTVFLSASSNIFGPMIASLFAQERRGEVEQVFKTATKWIIAASLPAYVLMILFPEVILSFFGRPHAGAATCLVILAVGHILHAGTGSVGQVSTMAGRSYLVLINNLATLAVNVPLNLILIPRYGVIGAALATAISLGVINLLRVAELWIMERMHAYRLSHLKPIVAVACAAAIAAGLCRLVPALGTHLLWFPVPALVFFAVYLGVFILLGLEDDDRWVIERLQSRLSWLRISPR